MKTLVIGLMTTAITAFPVLANKADVLDNYSNIAAAKYADSLATAKVLQGAVNALIANPSAATLDAAKIAWLASRVPYQQTEVLPILFWRPASLIIPFS